MIIIKINNSFVKEDNICFTVEVSNDSSTEINPENNRLDVVIPDLWPYEKDMDCYPEFDYICKNQMGESIEYYQETLWSGLYYDDYAF